MALSRLILVLLALTSLAYYWGRRKSHQVGREAGGVRLLHSRPSYHGFYTALWCCVPAFAALALWVSLEPRIITQLVISDMPEEMRSLPPERLNLILNDVKNLVSGNVVSRDPSPAMKAAAEHYRRLRQIGDAALTVTVLALAMIGAGLVQRKISLQLRARTYVERFVSVFLIFCSSIAIFTTIGIVLSVLYEAIRFFHAVPLLDFLFGLDWSPQTAIRADQVGSSGSFGAVPVFWGAAMISAIAMMTAVPIGLMAAIYLSEYANKRFRDVAKPMMEVLAGIPTVVYGFFAAITVAPFIRDVGGAVHLNVSSESALAAGLIMGIMIIPFVSSLSDDVINAVPQSLRDGAYGLGATKSETIKHVVLPAALPGIVGSVLLAVSRAIGETMIVVMAAGLAANLTANPLQAVTTVTVQIVTLLVGDQEFDSPKTLAAFALGLVLFIATLFLNVIALYVVRKYREQYE